MGSDESMGVDGRFSDSRITRVQYSLCRAARAVQAQSSAEAGVLPVGNVLSAAAKRTAERVRDLLIPSTCLLCDAIVDRQGGLCAGCWGRARFIERPYCEVLGMPFPFDQGEGAVSPAAIADPPPFARLRSVMVYDDCARRLVAMLKFSDRTDLAPWMAQWMAVAGRELVADCDVVVPVPLHWLRLHQRRYNQSAELARRIAGAAGLDYRPQVLRRHRRTRRQVGLTSLERARNVQGAFRVHAEDRPLVEGRRILLVDDVYTTGATAGACARALGRAGAAAVDVLTFASVFRDDI